MQLPDFSYFTTQEAEMALKKINCILN